ncbi:MAG TPA: hypothetical protein VI389_12070 [Geobacteraceae bacterium]
MAATETLKFGLSIGAIFTGVIFIAFWAYFMLLGKNNKANHRDRD